HRTTVPEGKRELELRGSFAQQPILVLRPAAPEIAAHQIALRQVPVRLGEIRSDGKSSARVVLRSFRQAPIERESGGVAMRLRVFGSGEQRLGIGVGGRVELTRRATLVAQAEPRFRVVRSALECLLE